MSGARLTPCVRSVAPIEPEAGGPDNEVAHRTDHEQQTQRIADEPGHADREGVAFIESAENLFAQRVSERGQRRSVICVQLVVCLQKLCASFGDFFGAGRRPFLRFDCRPLMLPDA